MSIAPALNFCPTMSPFEKCLLQLTEPFFGVQDKSHLLTTRLQFLEYSVTCFFGNAQYRNPDSLFLDVDSLFLSAQYLYPVIFVLISSSSQLVYNFQQYVRPIEASCTIVSCTKVYTWVEHFKTIKTVNILTETSLCLDNLQYI